MAPRAVIEVPAAFRAMPRWWADAEGRDWLDALPALVACCCDAWGLRVDGLPRHGSNALVVPVRRGRTRLAVRFAPPRDDVAALVGALRLWDGRGTARLLDEDESARALLLERLDDARPLALRPVEERMEVLGGLTRRLAVPVPRSVRSTGAEAEDEGRALERTAALLEPAVVAAVAAAISSRSAASVVDRAVDGDLHADQVLAGVREPWLVVDPVLLRGDREHDVGRVLWTSDRDLPRDADVLAAFERFVDAAEVPRARAREWVLIRASSYLRWGTARGLTEDPPRCRRLLRLFA